MNFGQAIEAMKEGKKVARKGWNGKGIYVPGWLASQSDMLSEDLGIINE